MTADLWYPQGIAEPCDSSYWGEHFDSLEKFVLHTTEGGLGGDPYLGSRSYAGHPYFPNVTLAIKGGVWRICNHLPANRGALALQNLPGGVETNNGSVCQVEIAWQAARIGELPDAAFQELARFAAWLHDALGLRLQSSVQFRGDGSFGYNAPQRLSGPAFETYLGILGHQHVPEQDHWDPGQFDVAKLIRYATGQTHSPNNTGGGGGPTFHASYPHTHWNGFHLLKEGSTGDEVKWLQAWLNKLANQGLTVDGQFGPKTTTAVKNVQRLGHITVDGVVWTATYNLLDAFIAFRFPGQ